MLRYLVLWRSGKRGQKSKEFKESKKALSFWCSHTKQDATLWYGSPDNYEEYFHFSWINSWGGLKDEKELNLEWEKFKKHVESMQDV